MNPLVLLGLAGPRLAEGPVVGLGPQSVTIVVRGAIAGKQVEAERVGSERVLLQDPGVGYLAATFRELPARFMQLRLVLVTSNGRQEVYDGLVPLTGRDHEVVSFEVLRGAIPRGVRTAAAPTASSELAVDAGSAWNVRFGWGALVLGYTTALVLAAARR